MVGGVARDVPSSCGKDAEGEKAQIRTEGERWTIEHNDASGRGVEAVEMPLFRSCASELWRRAAMATRSFCFTASRKCSHVKCVVPREKDQDGMRKGRSPFRAAWEEEESSPTSTSTTHTRWFSGSPSTALSFSPPLEEHTGEET